jgi:hypothetical protein
MQQAIRLIFIDTIGRGCRMDAGEEEAFVGIDVSYPCDLRLIEKNRLYFSVGIVQHAMEGSVVQKWIERLRSEGAQNCLRGRSEYHACEFPRIMQTETKGSKAEHYPVVQINVISSCDEGTRHPQMHQKALAIIKMEVDIFAPT